jgi:hypothetical protein
LGGDLELPEGVPEVGEGGRQPEGAAEVVEGGARLLPDPGPNPVPLALGQGPPVVGPGRGLEGLPGPVESLDRPDPGAAGTENLGDLGGGVVVVGERDDAVSVLDRQGLHRRPSGASPTVPAPRGPRQDEVESALDHFLADLIEQPEMQRLRDVRLSNINSGTLTGAANISRFEHSIGTALLAGRTAKALGD